MRHLVRAGATALLVVLLSGTAVAKGPSEAVLTGPGLEAPIRLAGDGEPGSSGRLARLAEHSGLFHALFRPAPLGNERPRRDLGPVFVLSYVVPGPVEEDEVTQRVYPYAEGGPVTYTEPGQPFFEAERTRGGWFEASPRLTRLLVAEGLPRRPVELSGTASPGSTGDVDPWVMGLGLATIVAAGAVAAVLLRRRVPGPEPR